MATFIVGIFVAIALFFALRHVYQNFRAGKDDCCGSSCSSCGGKCSACHPSAIQK